MKLHDVTRAIRDGMAVYPGDPEVRVRRVAGIKDGADANVSELRLGSHTGTHIDPPRHILDDGAAVDELALDAMIGPAVVVEVPGGEVGVDAVNNAGLDGAERVLFKTRDLAVASGAGAPPGRAYGEGFACLAGPAARRLVELGVRLVGVDGPSVDKADGSSHDTHRTLLGAGVVVVEGLDLSGVGPGKYGLVCLPLKLAGGDGGPARVVLTEG